LSYGTLNPAVLGAGIAVNSDGTASVAPATANSIGGVIVGNGLAVDAAGKITVTSAASQTPWLQDINAAGFRLLGAGNVGIGTASPAAALHVNSNSQHILLTGGGASKGAGFVVNTGAGDPTQGGLTLQRLTTAGAFEANLLTLNLANGYVGIVTLAPACALDVAGSIRSTAQVAPTSGAGIEVEYNPASALGSIVCYDRSGAAWKSLSINASPLCLNNSGQGNVGIGTPTPGYALDVVGSARVQGGNSGFLFNDRTTSNSWTLYATADICRFWQGASDVVTFDRNGNMVISGAFFRFNGARSTIFYHGDTAAQVGGLQIVGAGSGAGVILTPTDNSGAPVNQSVSLGGFGAFNGNTVGLWVSGNVGIGTNAPTSALDVIGAVQSSINQPFSCNIYNAGGSNWVYRAAGATIQMVAYDSSHLGPGSTVAAIWVAPVGAAGAAAPSKQMLGFPFYVGSGNPTPAILCGYPTAMWAQFGGTDLTNLYNNVPNGYAWIQAVTDTSIKIWLKGSDGTSRGIVLTIS